MFCCRLQLYVSKAITADVYKFFFRKNRIQFSYCMHPLSFGRYYFYEQLTAA